MAYNVNVSPKQFAFQLEGQTPTIAGRDTPVDDSWMDRDMDPVISSAQAPVKTPSAVLSEQAVNKPPSEGAVATPATTPAIKTSFKT